MPKKYRLDNGDCRELLALYVSKGWKVDSIVTDPPYELGFMGKAWDKSGIANDVELWKLCFQVLKPGGHLLSFGGSRTYHRMVCAIEDAGFEIRDQIMWVYGQGFPKSLDVSKAIDKAAGVKREVLGYTENARPNRVGKETKLSGLQTIGGEITEPETELAKQWQGFGTAIKPAHEPIVLARKPLSEKTIVENVLKHGTGAINIDKCRIKFSLDDDTRVTKEYAHNANADFTPGIEKHNQQGTNTLLYKATGRFPANLIHDGSDEVMGYFPEKTNRFFYSAKASKEDRKGSKHPTVKPIALMRYLCRLITPPGGTILDPFAGSGTTGQAAIEEGFKVVLIEKELEYFNDITKRLEGVITNEI